jgi:hypothetical protein
MNQVQRRAIAIGASLAILSGLFPSFEGRFDRQGENFRVNLGRTFLLTPPSQAEVMRRLFHRAPNDGKPVDDSVLMRASSRIMISETTLTMAVILIGTVGFVIIKE